LRRELLSALCLTVLGFGVNAQDRLISGPGSTLTENKCKICHELQHIRRTPLSRAEWADNVRNMKERGTPMNDAEMAIILDYLATYYNREKPAPPPSPDTLASGGDDPVQKLLNAHACVGCHALDQRVVGPSFKEVATKYAGDARAAEKLAEKIRSGGQGAWGELPMPPNPGLSDAELQTLAGWVLQQK
jgi:cytochrome c551/c552